MGDGFGHASQCQPLQELTPQLQRVHTLSPGASPLGVCDVQLPPNPLTPSTAFSHFSEKCVMNNYFGIGLDAKISLEFNNKRDEHPKKCRLAGPPLEKHMPLVPGCLQQEGLLGCQEPWGWLRADVAWLGTPSCSRFPTCTQQEGAHSPSHCPASPCSSRTKNMMWYGVLGTKELLQRTYKNLEQRVQLEVWVWGTGTGWGAAAPQAQPSLAVRRGAHLAAEPAGHRGAQHPQLCRGHQLLGRH